MAIKSEFHLCILTWACHKPNTTSDREISIRLKGCYKKQLLRVALPSNSIAQYGLQYVSNIDQLWPHTAEYWQPCFCTEKHIALHWQVGYRCLHIDSVSDVAVLTLILPTTILQDIAQFCCSCKCPIPRVHFPHVIPNLATGQLHVGWITQCEKFL